MCTKMSLKIKSVNPAAPKFGFVPCGKCYECRNVMRSSWVFRLRVELDELCKKGWKIGFITLTYNNECLPHIPAQLFRSEYKKIPCFDKNDIRTFFIKLKKDLLKKFDCRKVVDKKTKKVIQDTRIRYMVCGEFGEHTQRPHYHGIVCFPPSVPAEYIYEKICDLWSFGFVFPRYFNGGCDSSGYVHKPFICDSVKAAAVYAAKYVCKDLAYYDFIQGVDLYKKRTIRFAYCSVEKFDEPIFDEWTGEEICIVSSARLARHVDFDAQSIATLRVADYMPFHFQSRSLGLSFLDGKTDSEKLDLLLKGYSFVGDNTLSSLPVYLKNKIIFNPRYIYDEKTNKRLVRRDSTEFFRRHYRDIFQKKVEVLTKFFTDFTCLDFWKTLGASRDEIKELKRYSFRPDWMAMVYLTWYGVPYKECYDLGDLPLSWYRRYDPNYVNISNLRMHVDVGLIPRYYYEEINYFVIYYMSLFAKYSFKTSLKKMYNEREISRINDLWKSRE